MNFPWARLPGYTHCMRAEKRPMPQRRTLLVALPALLAGCAGGGDEPAPLPPLVSGYRHLTPIRLNVATVEIPEPPATAVRVDLPAPLRPDAEMRRMAEERLVPMGTAGQARFLIQTAEFRRESTGASGGLFGGSPGVRFAVRMQARLEIVSAEGQRVGFVEAQATRQRTLPGGQTEAARNGAAEEVVRQAMEELNVEFEFQIRRALRAWLVEGAAPPPVGAPGGIEREELPRS
jgi:hypothetical protein